MRKSAQSMVEISLIAGLVGILALATWLVFKNQSQNIANLSKSNMNTQSVDLTTLGVNDPKRGDKIPYHAVETAGGSSLIGLSSSQFNLLMSNITYAQLDAAIKADPDLLTRINNLEKALNIPYRPIVATDINADTLSVVSAILNQLSTMSPATLATSGIPLADITSCVGTVKGLLTEAQANLPTTNTSTIAASTAASTNVADSSASTVDSASASASSGADTETAGTNAVMKKPADTKVKFDVPRFVSVTKK